MNNKLVVALVLIVVLGGAFLLFKGKSVAPVMEETVPAGDTTTPDGPAGGVTVEVTLPAQVKEFSVDAVPYSFSPSSMTVNKGDTVKITLKNKQGTHDLKIDEFKVGTRTLSAGEEQTITFVADKAGSFQYYCSIGNHRAMGMWGTLTVK